MNGPRPLGMAAVLVILVILTVGAGCAHRPEAPARSVAAFGTALAHGDLRAAYGLTSRAFQRRMPFEAFAAALRASAAESAALGRRLVAEAAAEPPRAEVSLDAGERVPLVLEGGVWRLDGPVLEAWGQATPRAAVRTFVRALDARRYDVMLRLVPDRYRAGLTADGLRAFWEGEHKKAHRVILERLRAAADAPLVEAGGEARLSLPGATVRLVCESGAWKIEDPNEY